MVLDREKIFAAEYAEHWNREVGWSGKQEAENNAAVRMKKLSSSHTSSTSTSPPSIASLPSNDRLLDLSCDATDARPMPFSVPIEGDMYDIVIVDDSCSLGGVKY
jgi:hypothetical protein